MEAYTPHVERIDNNLNKGVKHMERAIDGVLVGLMVSVAFLVNYSYLMS